MITGSWMNESQPIDDEDVNYERVWDRSDGVVAQRM